jgi:hypothetical protein
MPLTLAHPAAVLPLIRLRTLDALPLIIGSVMPDIGYYLPHQIRWYLTDAHSFVGSFIFCLPVALALLAMLVALQIPMLEPLPTGHRQFVASLIERFKSRRLYLAAAVPSILIGAWSHIVWDSFTHRNRWAVRHLSLLRESLELPLIGSFEIFRALQYISSVVGLVVVVVCYISAERRFVRAYRPADIGANAPFAGFTAGDIGRGSGLKSDTPASVLLYRLSMTGLTSGVAVLCALWFVSGLVLVMLRAYQIARSDR